METRALIIGGGPAGLMAAEQLAEAGHAPLLVDAMPSLGRKFLMAGKIRPEPDQVLGRGSGRGLRPRRRDRSPPCWRTGARSSWPAGPRIWASSFSQARLAGVFPTAMKASPLLRAWLRRLSDQGAETRTRWRWTGLSDGGFAFETPDGPRVLHPEVCVLALGGASLQRLGSDGAWVPWLRAAGVTITDFAPANVGLRVEWSEHMERVLGQPVKGTALHADDAVHRGEYVISKRGA